MRIVMMGTGPFAVPTFRALLESRHDVVALVTQPQRAVRGRPNPPAPMREVAAEFGVPVLDFENINSYEGRQGLQCLNPDLLVVADYGQILSPEALATAPRGGVNLHGSLLPKYRGAAPINWAIYHGDSVTGVTTLHITPAVDAGPCLLQASTAIRSDETAVELEQRLAVLGAPLVIETIEKIERGETEPIPQAAEAVTKARRLRKSDGIIDWHRSAQQIKNQVRAFEPWPNSYTFWRRERGEPLRLILDRVRTVATETGDAPPGTILKASDGELLIATGEGVLRVERLQPAGKRVLEAVEFLRGYPIQVGDLLGAEPEANSH